MSVTPSLSKQTISTHISHTPSYVELDSNKTNAILPLRKDRHLKSGRIDPKLIIKKSEHFEFGDYSINLNQNLPGVDNPVQKANELKIIHDFDEQEPRNQSRRSQRVSANFQTSKQQVVVYQSDKVFIPKQEQSNMYLDAPKKSATRRTKLTDQVNILYKMIVSIPDVNTFVKSPVPPGWKLEASIKRDRSKSKSCPTYSLHLSHDYKYLMSAKRLPFKLSSTYVLCDNSEELQPHNPHHLATLQSNFLGTSFSLVSESKHDLLAHVLYDANCINPAPIRKLRVQLQEVPKNGEEIESSIGVNDNMAKELISKQPKWDDAKKEYVMKFDKRVLKPSVKNFILKCPNSNENILLFGKVNKDLFNMDVIYPLTPLQAFGIALSSFDKKFLVQ